jgi:hypothetical protein
MSRCIAYTVDGVTSIIVPNYDNKGSDEDEVLFLRRIASAALPPGAANVIMVERENIPRDRDDRHTILGEDLFK